MYHTVPVAHRELSGERIRAHHDRPLRRIQTLIERGKRENCSTGERSGAGTRTPHLASPRSNPYPSSDRSNEVRANL